MSLVQINCNEKVVKMFRSVLILNGYFGYFKFF